MPELVRKHKTQKPPQQHNRHKYHHHHHMSHQHYHNPYKSFHQQPYLPVQYSPATYQSVKHSRRAVKSTPPLPPPPAPYPPMRMTHNHLDMGPHGDEFHAGDMPDHLLYTPDAPQPMPIANYGPALFGNSDAYTGGVAADGDNGTDNKQQSHATVSMMPLADGTQQLMQHMELMSALAAAAAAAAGGGAGGVSDEEDDAGGGGAGVGISETNTLLADDFLADLQRAYANGKYPITTATTHLRPKKKNRGVGVVGETDDAAVAFPLTVSQQRQQQQKLQLMRQQQQQQHQFHGVNYFTPPKARPQAQMLRPPLAGSNSNSNSNYNNNYNYYQQLAQYKSKKQHHYNNNNNDIYSTAASDEDNEGYADDEPNDSKNNENNEDEDDSDDDVSLFFSNRPTTSTLPSTAAAVIFSSNDYDDNDDIKLTYNSNNKNYKHNYFEAVDEGVNPVSFQPTTGYGAAAFAVSQPTSATAVTRLKMRPYRQLQQHRYTSQQKPFGILGQQQQQLVTTTQPINVIGPTANDFDDQQQQQQHKHHLHHHQEQLPPPPSATAQQQQQQHKFTVSPATRYKKRKNRIKTKPNRNRILTH